MSNRPRILIVDDDRDIVRALCIRLNAAGFDVDTAHDGLAGVAAAKSGKPDAIILDIRMPGMDGLTALSRLREQKSTRHIPTIILTANVVETVRSKALGLGAYCFLKKPCDPGDLLKTVRGAIGQTDRQATDGTKPVGN